MLTLATRAQRCILFVGIFVVASKGMAFAGDPVPGDVDGDVSASSVSAPNVVPNPIVSSALRLTGRASSPVGAIQGNTVHSFAANGDTAVATPPAGAGSVMTALYIGFAATQALDAHSTLLAIGRGAHESNPLVQPFADKPLAVLGVKAGLSVGIVYMVERVRRRSRVGAILTMVALNSTAATPAARNYSIAARLNR